MADHDDDAVEGTPGYVAPAKVGLEEMKNKDADDEALNRWKAKLLEGASAGASSVPSPPLPSAHFSMLALTCSTCVLPTVSPPVCPRHCYRI